MRHWADGGASDIDNAALLCQRHHTFVHTRRLWATVRATPDEEGQYVVWDLNHGSDDRHLERLRAESSALDPPPLAPEGWPSWSAHSSVTTMPNDAWPRTSSPTTTSTSRTAGSAGPTRTGPTTSAANASSSLPEPRCPPAGRSGAEPHSGGRARTDPGGSHDDRERGRRRHGIRGIVWMTV